MENDAKRYKDLNFFTLEGIGFEIKGKKKYPFVLTKDKDSIKEITFFLSNQNQVKEIYNKCSDGYYQSKESLSKDGIKFTYLKYCTPMFIITYLIENSTDVIRITIDKELERKNYSFKNPIKLNNYFIENIEIDTLINKNKDNLDDLIVTTYTNLNGEYWRIKSSITGYMFDTYSEQCFIDKSFGLSRFWIDYNLAKGALCDE